MSENPYANYPAERDRTGDGMEVEPTRMSILALTALLLSIPACCIPFLGIAAGPLAAILGIAGLVVVGRSNGRLSGRGLAATGIFLGVIATALWCSVGLGAWSVYTFYRDKIVVVGGQFVGGVTSGDYAKARTNMSTDAAGALSDEDLKGFAAALTDQFGAYKGAPVDPQLWFKSFKEAYSGAGKPPGGGSGGPDPPIPVALQFEKQLTIAYMIADRAKLQAKTFVVDDMLVILPDGRGMTLRPDGVAKRAAYGMSSSPVHWSELKKEKESPPAKPGETKAPEAPKAPAPT